MKKLYNLKDNRQMICPSKAEIEAFLSGVDLPTLSNTDAEHLSRPFTVKEITLVISTLPLNKSPGPDGLPNKYYRTFINALAQPLGDMFNQCMKEGALPEEVTMAHVSMLPKPGKTKDHC
ncbi:endonuclease reverse transcriptase [Pelobates cultripes]|uniref:Endonuclease reverse transcriptase n=1 Tax=Pelobates cultripes TaxID=61616 RepID=A0AAD1W9S1_PELCU|nr:endonuclease reverse transcriptase [Pelobates cultripes]